MNRTQFNFYNNAKTITVRETVMLVLTFRIACSVRGVWTVFNLKKFNVNLSFRTLNGILSFKVTSLKYFSEKWVGIKASIILKNKNR